MFANTHQNRTLSASSTRKSHKFFRQWAGSIIFLSLLALGALLCLPSAAHAAPLQQPADITQECFAVADEASDTDRADTLVRLNRVTGQTTVIGLTGTESVEAIVFDANNNLLGANKGQLGTLDLNTGLFISTTLPFGNAGGIDGEIVLGDVDGLTYDSAAGIFYGVHRRGTSSADLLFVFDPTTGAHVPNFFGPSIDYVPIEIVLDASNTPLDDVDDIAYGPITGSLYAAINDGGSGGILGTIDPTTGAVTVVGPFHYPDPYPANPALAGAVIDDVEGLAFFNDGQLYGSTGDNGPDENDSNQLFQIDKTTGLGTKIGAFPPPQQDYEGLACLAYEPAIALQKYTNGPGQVPADADTPTGPSIDVGQTVTWTYVISNSGLLTLTDLILTDDQVGQIGPNGAANCPTADTVLSPGDAIVCTATGIAQPGQYANRAVVSGTTAIGIADPRQIVTATDPSHYFGTDRLLSVQAEEACILDAPYINYVVSAINFTPENGVTIRWFGSDNQVALELPDQPFNGQLLWPGASVDSEGNGIGWPGWTFIDGVWVDQGSPLRPVVTVEFEVNPTESVSIDYPPANPTCSPGPRATVGDFVWQDENADGIQGEDEAGIQDVTVNLYRDDFSGSPVATTTTDASGEYLFTDVVPGTYCIEFKKPDGFLTHANVGDDDAIDSDGETIVDATTVRTTCFELSDGEVDLAWDLGLYEVPNPAIVIEKATNGQDADEPTGPSIDVGDPVIWTYVVTNNGNVALTNVTVDDDEGVAVSCPQSELAVGESMTCSGNGTAQLGQYANTGYVTGTPTVGDVTEVTDDDPSHYIGRPKQDTPTPLATVGNFVWFDDNKNGIQDEGEAGVDGVIVRLFQDDFSGDAISTQTTSDTGEYLFAGIEPGTYCLEFGVPEDFTHTQANVGDDDGIDSDGETVHDTAVRSACFILVSGAIDLTRPWTNRGTDTYRRRSDRSARGRRPTALPT